MGRESDLHLALAAHQLGFLTGGQLLDCAAAWLNELDCARFVPGHAARTPEALLRDGHFLDEAGAESARAAVAEGRAIALDPEVRQGLLDLHPPPDVRAWIAALPERPRGPAPFQPLPRDERYRLGSEIARGGLGRIVEATDGDLEREVAIKLVLAGAGGDAVDRFVREARVAARLDHPNIVPVHDFGEMPGTEGKRQLFLAMKRVKGQDLGAVLRGMAAGDGRFSRVRLLGIFQDVCLGIAFAHSKGVLHRDLKPSNVMIGDYGETLIVDWGLAKVLGEAEARPSGSGNSAESPSVPDATQLTVVGDVIGTPAYMSPEQAGGHGAQLDARSDVYSLGAILYAILTGRAPVEGRARWEILEKVRAGRIEPPSKAAREPVPPELDAICLKAMSLKPDQRHATALELHQDVQLFLEGVKERERARKEAAERVERGRAHLARWRALEGEVREQEGRVQAAVLAIHPWQPLPEKKPLWEAEERLRSLREERVREYAAAGAEFEQALAVDSGCEGAADGLCELSLDRYLEAEGARERDSMILYRSRLERYDRRGAYRARLDAPGRLELRAFVFGCGCLKPVRVPGWRVEFSRDFPVAWREGGPAPGEPVTHADRPVPEVRIFPAGAKFGHGPGCPRRELAGVAVDIARYESRDHRLQPGPARALGTTPLSAVELEQGSYLCTLTPPAGSGLAPVLLPVRIERGGVWKQDVNFYREEEIPAGFVCVPGGPFRFGGAYGGGPPEEERVSRDLFVAKFPVTAGEYCDFLNALPADDARKAQPRNGQEPLLAEGPGGFAIREGDARALLNRPDLPVMGISWFDAAAYAAWRSTREGRVFRLLHDEEFDKAARGVDRRIYPWGDDYDGTFSNTSVAHEGGGRLLPVGAYPTDESPYGVRDLAGNMGTWTWNAIELPYRSWCSVRGGNWFFSEAVARSPARRGNPPAYTGLDYGVRICLPTGA